ncbi:MAG: ferritin-like domain-containing protein [Gemmatimonadetes bacterium]|nr:ferritin-like domain-containing protein [Gemmatimonadota bacterium]
MAANTLNDVFRHGLGDMYDAEQQIISVLDQLETETQSVEVRGRIRRHREETQRHIQNLERCFELLGSEAPRVQCTALRGLREEKRTFQAEQPSPQALEVFNLDAASKTEHYEIASYRGLVDQAKALRQDDISRLLEQNLRQEEEMSRWIDEQQPKILEQFVGTR